MNGEDEQEAAATVEEEETKIHEVSGRPPKRTSNNALQTKLERLVDLLTFVVREPNPSTARTDAIMTFCREFIPSDVSDDDLQHFSESLVSDEEFLLSILRDLQQCASGQGVETIGGNQKSRAVFTLLPPERTVTGSVDIVREVAFVSTDRGVTWTAEG